MVGCLLDPKLDLIMQRDRTGGYLGRVAASKWRLVSQADTSGSRNKTTFGGFMEFNRELKKMIFYYFQANNHTSQGISIKNALLCTQKSSVDIYSLWINRYLGIIEYYKQYSSCKLIFILDWSYPISRTPSGCKSNMPTVLSPQNIPSRLYIPRIVPFAWNSLSRYSTN